MMIKTLLSFGLGIIVANESARKQALKLGDTLVKMVGNEANNFIKKEYDVDVGKQLNDVFKNVMKNDEQPK